MAKLLWCLLSIFVSAHLCGAYKILIVFPMPSKSHSILGEGYVRNFLVAGHEVTYVTTFPTKNPHPKLREVDIGEKEKLGEALDVKQFIDKEFDLNDPKVFFFVLGKVAIKAVQHENVQKLINDPAEEFDLVIVEWMFSEIYSGFSAVFNCPFVWSSSIEPHWLILRLIDEATNPAYVADAQSGNVAPLNFVQRAHELWFQLYSAALKSFVFHKTEVAAYEQFLVPVIHKRGRIAPSYEELRYNASMVFGNSHYSLGQAVRLPQNYKAIAGYHIDTDLKPLPENVKKIMDNAKNGVIYFSMGSNLRSKDMPDEMKQGLLKMFGTLEHTVLWKFEDVLPDLPKNVHILKWAPQLSILAHPNCVLFITHGGLLSITEAVHFGVPIIGTPVFADQFTNVERAVKKGFAKEVPISYTMAGNLKLAIEDVLGDPRYMQRAKELSALYHDRPMSPGTELVYWAEHVVRTRGAPHLRSPALQLSWYQKAYLDLLAVAVAVTAVAIYIMKRLSCLIKITINKKKKIE